MNIHRSSFSHTLNAPTQRTLTVRASILLQLVSFLTGFDSVVSVHTNYNPVNLENYCTVIPTPMVSALWVTYLIVDAGRYDDPEWPLDDVRISVRNFCVIQQYVEHAFKWRSVSPLSVLTCAQVNKNIRLALTKVIEPTHGPEEDNFPQENTAHLSISVELILETCVDFRHWATYAQLQDSLEHNCHYYASRY